MCGISGFLAKKNSQHVARKIFAMNQVIKHRGPDGEGFVLFSENEVCPVYSAETPEENKHSKQRPYDAKHAIEENNTEHPYSFGHRRLAIIDLSPDGHQPICDETEQFWLTFNGEIYNYIELRNELKTLGFSFKTQSDSEVILQAYKAWGTDCVQHFNGMWAFALFDKTKQHIFFSRDRVGVKPLYFVENEDFFAFSSEYKTFIKTQLVPFEINQDEQFNFIMNGTIEQKNQSLFQHIHIFPHAHNGIYSLSSKELTLEKYYSPEIQIQRFSEKEIINQVSEKIEQAISLRLRSDVEVGACLSGGLDSSIIASYMHALFPQKRFSLFTSSFPNEGFDETNYAKIVAESTHANWKTVNPSAAEFFEDIETLNYYQDLPVWSTSTYAQHRVMKLASEQGVKVVLDGQGADELFAGYHHHYLAYWNELIHNGKYLKFLTHLGDSKATVPNAWSYFSKQKAKDISGISKTYSSLFLPEFNSFAKTTNTVIEHNLNAQLYSDYFSNKLQSFLKCEDRSSMAFSIESRVPFSDDVELVQLAFQINSNLKLKNGISKYVLREATKHKIPSEIYQRKDKIGFEAPLGKWLLERKKHVYDTILKLDFIQDKTFPKIYEQLIVSKPELIFRLYSFAIWKDIFSKI
jgi:asparagine synthase (glutamine-hydrolysing)